MTLVNIDIRGVASSTGPEDRVVLRAPTIRERSGGGLVSTREEVVHLVDGVGSVRLDPGPVMVKFLCEGISDTGEKPGTVPDSETVDIFTVLSGSLVYTPAVVSAAVQARNEAVEAATRAEAGADRVGSAEQVGEWAGEAKAAAESADADRQVVSQAKSDVDALTGRAERATENAEVAAADAETQAGVATDAAGQAAVSEQAAAQSANDADLDRVDAQQASTRAVQAEQVATDAATTATNKATEAGLAADRAEAVADSTHWQDDRLSVMGQLGPSLRGPKGDQGDPGPKGDPGDGAGDVLWSELNPVLDGKAAVSHNHTALQISDATTVGRNVLTATSQATARTAIGAGTSSLVLGTSSSTAARGDHTHTPASIGAAPASHTHSEYAESSRVTALEGNAPIIVSSLPSSPLPGRIYLVTE